MKNDNKIIKHALSSRNKEYVDQLYVAYIKALVKSEKLQNNLEKFFTLVGNSPNRAARKQTHYINNSLNNLLVKLMEYQNTINYINSSEIIAE